MKRDLLKDRETCKAATEGQWEVCTGEVFGHLCTVVFKYVEDTSSPLGSKMLMIADFMPEHFMSDYEKGVVLIPDDHRPNMNFFIQARDGWEHAIGRAIAAEAEAERLRHILEAVHSTLGWALNATPDNKDVFLVQAHCRLAMAIDWKGGVTND